jgi:hypothetical protein
MSENPLIKMLQIPGETFRLPSSGLFYLPEAGILDSSVQDGEVVVHPMTALDELCFKTPDLLFSGKAVEQVFARCIPNILKPKLLLAKDVDFLLICLRKVSYGEEMELQYTHTCENAKMNLYSISVTDFIKKSKRIDPSRMLNDFSVTLTNSQTVKITPLNFGNFVELMQANDKDTSPEKLAQQLFSSVSKIISSVDGITDKDQIVDWLAHLPPKLLNQITASIDKTTEWGPDFMAPIKCKDCGVEESVQAPLNPLSFFT